MTSNIAKRNFIMTKETERLSIIETVKALENVFDRANEYFYDNELPKVVITFSPDEKRKTYGHFTTGKVWHKEDASAYEINIVCNCLENNAQVVGTMLHEMAHLYNTIHEIKDCSGNGNYYHNKKFGNTANAHGLNLEKSEKYGWTGHTLSEDGKVFLETVKDNLVGLTRDTLGMGTKKSKKSYYLYQCPCCGAKARTTKPLGLVCYECDELMIGEDDN